MRRRKGPSPGRNQRPARSLPASAVSSKTPDQQIPNPQTPPPQTPFEREQTTKRRGEISELAFALAAARHGFGISRPYGDSERYDLILDSSHLDPTHLPSIIPNRAEGAVRNPLYARPRLIRVQVKATTQFQCGLYRV